MRDRRTALLWFLFLLLAGTVRAAPLQFSVTTDVSQPGTWYYTAHNDEPAGSPLFISSFLVVLNGPILVFGAPDSWTTETDYISYVLWFNLDTALPYPHDIAPGESLGGFFVESPSPLSGPSIAQAAPWNHVLDELGPLSDNVSVLAPAAAVPEPALWPVMLTGLLAMAQWRRRPS